MNETPYDRTMAAVRRAEDAEREATERGYRQMLLREPTADELRETRPTWHLDDSE